MFRAAEAPNPLGPKHSNEWNIDFLFLLLIIFHEFNVLARYGLAGLISQTAKLAAQGVPSCRSFSFEELKEATDDFDSSRFLGEGSLGKVWFT